MGALEVINAKILVDTAAPPNTADINVEILGKLIVTAHVAADILAPTKKLVTHVKLVGIPVLDMDLEFMVLPTVHIQQVVEFFQSNVVSIKVDLEVAGPERR